MKEKQFCRYCLSAVDCKNMYEEYCYGKRKEIYAEMLLDTLNINVINPSYNTSLICESCIGKLRNAAVFKAQILKAQEIILKGWEILKNKIDFDIQFDDFGFEVDIFKDNDSVWDVESSKQAGQILNIKLEPKPDKVPKDNLLVDKEVLPSLSTVSKNLMTTRSLSTISQANASKSSVKLQMRKGVTKVNSSSIKNVNPKKSTKTVKAQSKKEDLRHHGRLPMTQSEIDARENTLKLIQNSNLCLFRSLKTKFGCFMCNATFVDAVELREHFNTHRNMTLLAHRISRWRGLSYKKADITNLNCNQCLRKCHNLTELLNHLIEQHNLLFFGNQHFLIPYRLSEENQCVLCELKFNSFLRLSIHMNSHYTNNVCENCGLSFINRVSLRTHVQSQHREKKCSFCPAKFLTVSSKAKHMRKVHKVSHKKRYCNLCDKTFPYTYMLNKHKIDEHGAKKTVVNCSECGKTFFQETNLRVHVRSVHKRERNYPCEVCGTRFFTKCDQKRHEKTHNDVRSFSCNNCNAKFKSKDSWRRHMKRQHGHIFTQIQLC